MTPIYLDHAAATPLDENVLQAMLPYLTTEFYNPSATYNRAKLIHTALEKARSTAAACLGARSSEIIFTAGGTEANNLAIHGVLRRFPRANVVTSAIEHSAVLQPVAAYDRRSIAVAADGRLDLKGAAQQIDDQTVLVSCMYVNNEIGTVQPIKALAKIIAEVRAARRHHGNPLPLYLHVDACQAPNYLDLQVARLGADLISLNGSKIYGPKQTGALYVKGGVQLQPLTEGGGQERGLRSGTENVAGIVGFAFALQLTTDLRRSESDRLRKLQQHWYVQLADRLPTAIVNGSRRFRLPNNIHITLPGSDNERLLIQLDEAGIMAAAGSACSASSQTPSTVLAAIGLDDATARSSLRFTMGRGTTESDIARVIATLSSLITQTPRH